MISFRKLLSFIVYHAWNEPCHSGYGTMEETEDKQYETDHGCGYCPEEASGRK